jgi:DNA-binding phage protein
MAKFHRYEFAEALTSDEAIEVFLADALETGDDDHVSRAMKIVEAARERNAAPPAA